MCVWHCILSAYQIAWRYEKCYNDNMVLNFDPYVCLNSFKVQNIVKNFDKNRETILREINVFTKTTFSFTYKSNHKKKKIKFANLATFSHATKNRENEKRGPQKLISRNFISKTCDNNSKRIRTTLLT